MNVYLLISGLFIALFAVLANRMKWYSLLKSYEMQANGKLDYPRFAPFFEKVMIVVGFSIVVLQSINVYMGRVIVDDTYSVSIFFLGLFIVLVSARRYKIN